MTQQLTAIDMTIIWKGMYLLVTQLRLAPDHSRWRRIRLRGLHRSQQMAADEIEACAEMVVDETEACVHFINFVKVEKQSTRVQWLVISD